MISKFAALKHSSCSPETHGQAKCMQLTPEQRPSLAATVKTGDGDCTKNVLLTSQLLLAQAGWLILYRIRLCKLYTGGTCTSKLQLKGKQKDPLHQRKQKQNINHGKPSLK